MDGSRKNYDQMLNSAIARRTKPAPTLQMSIQAKSAGVFNRASTEGYQASPIYEIYNKLGAEGSAVRYTVASMARLDPRYTEITYEQGDRVKNQLCQAFESSGIGCDFEYQGSVTNDTHIKSHSDIDLLCITRRFETLESPQVPTYPYGGDPVQDLKDIRETGAKTLRSVYPAAEIDDSGSKSVSIEGGSLSRKIDIVPANWHNTNQWAASQAKRFRSVEVLDLKSGTRLKNSPFMHNYQIKVRDEKVSGGLRKVVRLMKSLRYDRGTIKLSSYDLTAIGYHMPEHQLHTFPGGEIPLLCRLKAYIDFLGSNKEYCLSLDVPDGSRKIFTSGHATFDGLVDLQDEVDDLLEAVRHSSAVI